MRRRSGDAKMVVGVTTAISACGTGTRPSSPSYSLPVVKNINRKSAGARFAGQPNC